MRTTAQESGFEAVRVLASGITAGVAVKISVGLDASWIGLGFEFVVIFILWILLWVMLYYLDRQQERVVAHAE